MSTTLANMISVKPKNVNKVHVQVQLCHVSSCFQPDELCITLAHTSCRQFFYCDFIAADLAPSPKEKKCPQLGPLFILNSDTR